MRPEQFWDHHGVTKDPFASEDAQTDAVFKGHCIHTVHHPSWAKIYGDADQPATSVVFGEKGAGKTAMGLQIVRHLADHNAKNPSERVFVIPYDDFNPFLDRFRERLPRRKQLIDRALAEWRLWDHMDAILSVGVTQLIDRILQDKHARHPAVAEDDTLALKSLDASQVRDVVMLAACYDQSRDENRLRRWQRLRRRVRFSTFRSKWDAALGIAVTVAVLGLIGWLGHWDWLQTGWPYAAIVAGWLPWLWRRLWGQWRAGRIVRQLRVLEHETAILRGILLQFPGDKLADQPLPVADRTDDRYQLLSKFQSVLRTLGFVGIVVLVDRLDEPNLVNGSADLMRALLWPLLDNKLLKHPGMGLKMLLPVELLRYIDRAEPEFYQHARLDKQNLIRSLEWTGQALYDLADARMKACAKAGDAPTLRGLFDESLDAARLQAAFASLRVPRHLFKFMFRVVADHCNDHTDEQSAWKISAARFESTLAVYRRGLEDADRGTGVV